MPPPESGSDPAIRRRRVRKHRRSKDPWLKAHYGFEVMGCNTKRVRQQIANGDTTVSWEGEYRDG